MIDNKQLNPMADVKNPFFEIEGDLYGVEYDIKTGRLYAGGITNIGLMHEYYIQYNEDFTPDYNLQSLYNLIFLDKIK